MNERTGRFRKSMNRIRWSKSLMQLFWTAGPVTGLGLIGGYWIGYGKLPPFELLIYFISFTVFSGLIGLVAKVVYDGTRGHLKEQGERDIRTVNDKLGDLVLEVRDMQVEGYEGDARKREAALQLLRRVDLTPYGVSIAFTNLTGDPETGRIMAQLSAYRKTGLNSRVNDLYETYRPHIENAIAELEASSPEAARELSQRFTGQTNTSLKKGVERDAHFLQRVMSAIEFNNPLLMTLSDVEEMIILAFELVNGREIPTLVFAYSGKWKFARTLDQLERRRSSYRVIQARGGNRMRALAAFLRESDYVEGDELPKGLPMHQLIIHINDVLNRLSTDIELLSDRSSSSENNSPERLRHLISIMETSVELYKLGYDGFKEIGKRHAQLIEASGKWEKLINESPGSPGDLKIGPGRRGLRIRENVISLNEEARLDLCRHLVWYFEREGMTGKGAGWHTHHRLNDYEKRTESARLLAIELALALEPHIGLSRPEIQRNINATRAIYLGELNPDMSAAQKEELGQRMAREVDQSLGSAAEQLAEALVRLYRVELHEEARDFLHYQYGARPEMLQLLESSQQQFEHPVSFMAERPPAVPEPSSKWSKALSAGRKRLRKN
ncbi:MAG: hypothetical protein LAT84_11975 [Balneolia bacterium]|nr:hypothetical protein [Balneolia bacterium]